MGEVSLLQREDVDLARGRIVIKRLKSGLWREHPLWPVTAALLRAHLEARPAESSAPVFRGQGGPLRKRQIQWRFVRYREKAGLPAYLTCHSLRHSIATHLLDAGVSLEFVQDHLGHRSISSTTIYARITDHHRVALFRELERSPWIVQPGASGAAFTSDRPRHSEEAGSGSPSDAPSPTAPDS